MKKATIAAIACAIVLPIGGWFGYDAYATNQEVNSLRRTVKLASLHLSSVLEIQKDSSNITFGEYFKKADASVDELDKAALQIRSLATPRNKYASDGVLQYISNGQAVIRDFTAAARASMKADHFKEEAEALIKETYSSNTYTRDYARKQGLRAANEEVKALDEMVSTIHAVHPKLVFLDKQSAWAGRTFGEDAAVPSKLILDVAKQVETKSTSP